MSMSADAAIVFEVCVANIFGMVVAVGAHVGISKVISCPSFPFPAFWD